MMKRAAKRFDVSFTPHAVRHLVATEFIVWSREVEAPGDYRRQKALEAGLRKLMGWRSRRTMEGYIHALSTQEAMRVVRAFQDRIEQPFTADGAPLMHAVASAAGLMSEVAIDDPDARAYPLRPYDGIAVCLLSRRGRHHGLGPGADACLRASCAAVWRRPPG